MVNLAVSIMNTYDELRDKYGAVFLTLEVITVAFFLIDYVLRILIAKCKYPEEKDGVPFENMCFPLWESKIRWLVCGLRNWIFPDSPLL